MGNSLSTLRIYRRSLGVLLLSAGAVTAASCAGDSDESLAPPPPHDVQAARLAPPTSAARALESAFPKQADRVLGRLHEGGFIAEKGGYARNADNSMAWHIDVQLPEHAGDAARMTAPGGFEVRVREVGLQGEAELSGRAVTYRRTGGTAFWSVVSGGAEEWLHLAEGSVTSMDDVAAAWEIEGASPVAMNGAVALLDQDGNARAWVTAPEAFSKDGRAVDLRLSTQGNRIELHADARGEEVLVDPGWVAVGPVVTARYGTTLTLLNNGKAVLAGGATAAGALPGNAELYDPVANTWSAASTLVTGRYVPGAVLLASGKLMILGGQGAAAYQSSTEIYDPALNTWAAGPSMAVIRGLPDAVLLANGKVLAHGGYNGAAFVATAELYDPATNAWTATGVSATARGFATIIRLPSGKVLVAGGINGAINTATVLASAELYDPALGTWSAAGTMASARYVAASALLPNGKVLVAGGLGTAGASITNAEIYDPASNTWSAAAPMTASRAAQGGVLLGTGQLLSAGGFSGGAATNSSEIYDPATNAWTPSGNMASARYLAGATALQNGDALMASGNTGGAVTNTADRYQIGAPLGSACNGAAQCQSGFCADGVCCNSACGAGACDACSMAAGAPANGTCALLTGTPCNDNNACTQTDACNAGVCVGGNAVNCMPIDQCHDAGMCSPNTGLCSTPLKADGAACDDGNLCTQSDTCQTGACIGASPVTCMALDQCHMAGTCNVATGMCDNPTMADGTMCNDGDMCTQTDMCTAGACTGSNLVMCAAQDQCHDAGTCDAMTGTCSNPAKMDGTLCDDGDKCTQTDACTAGACTGGNPVTCTAQDQCHDAGTCDAMTGTCDNPAKADGAACDDGDKCTQTDSCTAGACTGAMPVQCMAADECHDAGTCSKDSGLCDSPAKADGTACTNGTCQAGSCVENGTTTGTGTGGTGGSATGGTATGGSATGGTSTGGTATGGSATGGDNQTPGGCGCRVAGEGDDNNTAPASAIAGLALAALTWSRRRRASRARA